MSALLQALKGIPPEVIISVIQSHPDIVVSMLQKTRTFNIIGKALTVEDQIAISENYYRIDDFLESDLGQKMIVYGAEEFNKFLKL